MRFENYIDLTGKLGVSGLFLAMGNFKTIDENTVYKKTELKDKTIFEYSDNFLTLKSEFTKEENGVIIRRDTFKNLSENELTINSLSSRFFLPGNAYEVYTQYNGWEHESRGEWQKLVTQVSAASQGMRGCEGATPMMGFHNLYTGKNTVFHLVPNAQWEMTVRKFPITNREFVVLETGFYNKSLALKVKPQETISLPTVIFFEADSKTDLDAYRLHEVYNRLYPRKTLPIVYNSWLYCFDKLNIDELLKQTDCASKMGFEGFMIDAGWFGDGTEWDKAVGDWEENKTSGPCGRLSELSEYVREKGMIFGLWFEPERASPFSDSVKNHPEYYINDSLLDFANPEAIDYIFESVSKQIDKYKIGWVKFDFNASIPFDPTRNAFYRYIEGQKNFIERLRQKYPDLYITNCASGGYRMELGQGVMFDSFWLSDNQGPYEGLRILKDTLKRMPTGLIERWNVQKYCENFPVYDGKAKGRMIHCNDAKWDFLIGVDDSFSEHFAIGGPMGFSCDIAAFPQKYQNRWTEVIKEYKAQRDFYKTATVRILIDTEAVTAIQYSDVKLNTCIIKLFTKTVYANELIIYPVVENSFNYQYNDTVLKGRKIKEDGIFITSLQPNSCLEIKLTRK